MSRTLVFIAVAVFTLAPVLAFISVPGTAETLGVSSALEAAGSLDLPSSTTATVDSVRSGLDRAQRSATTAPMNAVVVALSALSLAAAVASRRAAA
jgi:hypothetical protein